MPIINLPLTDLLTLLKEAQALGVVSLEVSDSCVKATFSNTDKPSSIAAIQDSLASNLPKPELSDEDMLFWSANDPHTSITSTNLDTSDSHNEIPSTLQSNKHESPVMKAS